MQNVFCPHCETEQPMEIVEEGIQDSRQERMYVQRVRRCLICARYHVTAEVKSCLVHEYDQTKKMIEQLFEEVLFAEEPSNDNGMRCRKGCDDGFYA